MTPTTTLTLVDGVDVVVPDSLDLITCYVLQEQKDWFEDEIKFLRRLLRPGQEVIDIGANYGVYALSMAQTVGPTGRVWAFEPASSTAKLLAEGIAANDFKHVVLEQCALSSVSGTANLALNDNSELNALVHGAPASGASETVTLSTLDECLDRLAWRNIAFLKIDAEGEESNILTGGRRFFDQQSPLVQFEIKAGSELHLELVDQFAALGYASYRLVPGIGLLVPFDRAEADGFLLNLFACKPDRALLLAAEDRLSLGGVRDIPAAKAGPLATMWNKFRSRNTYDWRRSIVRLPYGAQLAGLWKRTSIESAASTELDSALYLYAQSRDSSLPAGERFAALETSFGLFRKLSDGPSKGLRLASLARVATDYGARSVAVQALDRLCQGIFQNKEADLTEPFLAPSERFDSIRPGDSIGDWVLAAALEQLERLESFSSFFARDGTQQRLEMIHALGFESDEMKRRSQLLQQRFAPRPA